MSQTLATNRAGARKYALSPIDQNRLDSAPTVPARQVVMADIARRMGFDMASVAPSMGRANELFAVPLTDSQAASTLPSDASSVPATPSPIRPIMPPPAPPAERPGDAPEWKHPGQKELPGDAPLYAPPGTPADQAWGNDMECRSIAVLHAKFGYIAQSAPAHLTDRLTQERVGFVHQSFEGLVRAAEAQDMPAMANSLVQVVFATKGFAVMLGLPWDRMWREALRFNMAMDRVVTPTGEGTVVIPRGTLPPQMGAMMAEFGYDPAYWFEGSRFRDERALDYVQALDAADEGMTQEEHAAYLDAMSPGERARMMAFVDRETVRRANNGAPTLQTVGLAVPVLAVDPATVQGAADEAARQEAALHDAGGRAT